MGGLSSGDIYKSTPPAHLKIRALFLKPHIVNCFCIWLWQSPTMELKLTQTQDFQVLRLHSVLLHSPFNLMPWWKSYFQKGWGFNIWTGEEHNSVQSREQCNCTIFLVAVSLDNLVDGWWGPGSVLSTPIHTQVTRDTKLYMQNDSLSECQIFTYKTSKYAKMFTVVTLEQKITMFSSLAQWWELLSLPVFLGEGEVWILWNSEQNQILLWSCLSGIQP